MPDEKTQEKTTVFAVYDKTFLRFVGGTHATKSAAEKVAKDRKVKSYEIREV